MIQYEGTALYPLTVPHVYINNEDYCDRANRKKSWFLLDLVTREDKMAVLLPEAANS